MTFGKYTYNSCLLYSLPKDVTIQSIGERKIEDALKKVTDFLVGFSDNSIVEFDSFIAHIPQLGAKNYELGLKKIEEAKKLLGPGVETSIGYSYPQGKPLPQRQIEWRFNTVDAANYLKFIIGQQPIPAFELPLFELMGSVFFFLTDQQGNRLPNQTNSSSLIVWLGRNSAISPTLWIPFTEKEEFFQYRDALVDKFPGKFNDKYLRKVKPVKSGTSYQIRKLYLRKYAQ